MIWYDDMITSPLWPQVVALRAIQSRLDMLFPGEAFEVDVLEEDSACCGPHGVLRRWVNSQ
jgi:hypothetical protein